MTYFPLSAQVALKGDQTVTGRVVGHDHYGAVEYTVVRWDSDGVTTDIASVRLTTRCLSAEDAEADLQAARDGHNPNR